MIEQLKKDKVNLAAELNESNKQATRATELKELAEKETTHLKLITQAAEMDKQLLQQQVQNLTGTVEHFRNTTVKSVNEFISKLMLDLNPQTVKQYGVGEFLLDAPNYRIDTMEGCIN